MSLEVVTKDDLQTFRSQLLNDLKELFSKEKNEKRAKAWLRSKEVRKLLNISAGTLQNLRITGKLQSLKIGGIY
jgi:hypothetical protein